jgi:hypothetical protein
MITDKLVGYGAAKKETVPGIEHRQRKGLNNRAPHQPTRRRERPMKRFKSPGQVQCFLSTHDQINNLFHFAATTFLPASTKPRGRVRSRYGQTSGDRAQEDFEWTVKEIAAGGGEGDYL